MIFKPELAQAVLDGRKTVTRRAVSKNPRSPWYRGGCALEVGSHYALQPGRSKPAVARICIKGVRYELFHASHISLTEARREGFADQAAFRAAWESMHGEERTMRVWRIEFRLHHEPRDCERALQAAPDYSLGGCTPAVFECPCGNVYEHVCDEAEGCFYHLRTGVASAA